MNHFVNEAAFFAWYRSVAKKKQFNSMELLNDVVHQYLETERKEYVVPAEKTESGKEESYPFNIDDIGRCGASTVFVYF